MSTFNDIDIECTACGEEFRATVWVAIHAGEDPKLKDLLRGGELNLVSCPACGHVSFQERFLIYQEPVAELVAYVYPDAQHNEEAELRKLMLSGFQEAQEILSKKDRLNYDPVLVFGLESLIEMLRQEDEFAEQSQVAQAFCKQNNIETTLLRPSQARRLGTMRVIPHVGKGYPPTPDDIIAGIDRLLTIDPVLTLYAKLKETIAKDPGWTLKSESMA